MDHEVRDGVLWVRIVGDPSTRGLLQLLEQFLGDARHTPAMPVLIDVRQAVGGPPRQELEDVSEYFSRRQDAYGRKGLLVASMLQYGLARVGQALNQVRGMDLEIYRDEQKAFDALGRDAAAE